MPALERLPKVSALVALLAAPAQGSDRSWGSLPDDAIRLSNPQCRIALVVGNGRYRHANNLQRAVHDARTMASTVELLGFEVIDDYDLAEDELREVVERFASRLKPGCVAFVYYSGHALEGQGGENYLLPTDLTGRESHILRTHAIRLGDLQAITADRGAGARIAFFDACRSLVFDGERGQGEGGMGSVGMGIGSFTGYSTSTGEIARDDSGFADALSRWMLVPGLTVEQVFSEVQNELGRQKAHIPEAQVPVSRDSLVGEFYFLPPRQQGVKPPPPPPPIPQADTVSVEGGTYQVDVFQHSRVEGYDPYRTVPVFETIAVEVRPFISGRTEVQQRDWAAVFGDNPSWPTLDGRNVIGPSFPVQMVTWLDAVRYCNSRSRQDGLEPYYALDGDMVVARGGGGWRLPTVDEWWVLASAGGANMVHMTWDSAPFPSPGPQGTANDWGVVDAVGGVEEWLDGQGPDKPVAGGPRFHPGSLEDLSEAATRPFDLPSPWRGFRVVRSAE